MGPFLRGEVDTLVCPIRHHMPAVVTWQVQPDQDWRLRTSARQRGSTIQGAVMLAAALLPSPG